MQKRLLTLLCATFFALCALNATVLFKEHFDRPLGTLSAGTWSAGSLPNDSCWHTFSPGTVQFQVVNSQLHFADYCSAMSGKAVQYSANHSRDYILFKNAVSPAAGSVYLAFLVKVNGLQTTSNAMSNTNANNSILSFAINASNNAMGSLNSRVIIRSVDDKTFQLGVSRRGETPQFASNELNANTTYLVVAEYKFIEGEKNDLINLYINPTKAEQTVAVTSVNPSTASADADQLVGVALCSNGNTPTNMLLDEIRVATSWAELWENNDIPTPTLDIPEVFDMGKVAVSRDPIQSEFAVRGENLPEVVFISSDNELLVPSVTWAYGENIEFGMVFRFSVSINDYGVDSAHVTFNGDGLSDQIVTVKWEGVKPVPDAGSELLLNNSFEQYSCNAMFGCSFEDWNLPLGSATANADDKKDGEVAMQVSSNTNVTLDQGVTLVDADYVPKSIFQFSFQYKVVSIDAGSTLGLDCYWEPVGGGDAEAMKTHDADSLQQPVASDLSGWQTMTVSTSKPTGSSYFRVRLKVPKNATVLFDDFHLVYTGKQKSDNPGGPDDPTPPDPSQDTWKQDFVWDDSNPLALMIEGFDGVKHNKPLSLEGWQNVAPADARPWWGFDETQTSIFDGSDKYAKATAYQFGKESTGNWEMWLVTPPLDYKNAASKLFAFSVMGQYMPDEGNPASLQIYYIDATDPSNVLKQDLTSSFSIPTTADENEKWITFYLDLAPYAQTVADVFHMAFRFVGPNGNEGAVTYYLDDISWGRTDLVESIQNHQSPITSHKYLKDGQLFILRDGKTYTIMGVRLD